MRGMLSILFFTAVTMICWGVYAPVLKNGKDAMGDMTGLRPFIGVGLAYFIIAVLAPGIYLRIAGEVGRWTAPGTFWSLVAGAAGAIGALGVILALVFGGNPIYVMPLVFGCAPIVNTATTMYMSKSYRQVGPMFLAGLILVIAGAVVVLVFRPSHGAHVEWDWQQLAKVLAFTFLTALSWGVYGPTLHKGQAAMEGSRLRPLICVGVSYFVIAVIVPFLLLGLRDDPGSFTTSGMLWSLAGGATGAIGALGVIMAFNSGGKPIYVMPLVFGGAPVINTFVSIWQSNSEEPLKPVFYAGLIIVAVGAVVVLVFAPRPGKTKPGGPEGAHDVPEKAHA